MTSKKNLKTIGWREWVALPDLGVKNIKAKVDTGARTSCLHATNTEFKKRGRVEYIEFDVLPVQKSNKNRRRCKAKVVEYRKIKSSNGQSELRPVIRSTIKLLGQIWEIDITLTNRDEMGFRFLLGRQSIRNLFLVNPGHSFYCTDWKKR